MIAGMVAAVLVFAIALGYGIGSTFHPSPLATVILVLGIAAAIALYFLAHSSLWLFVRLLWRMRDSPLGWTKQNAPASKERH